MDRNGFYGSARFHKIAEENGIKAHVGAEVSVTGLGNRLTPPIWTPHQHLAEPTRLSLLCETREGYQNLCQLITRFKMRETTKQEGSAKLTDLAEYSKGLVCLTGGDEGSACCRSDDRRRSCRPQDGRKACWHFRERAMCIVEVQRHRERAQEWRNQAALRIAGSLRLPVLATNGVRYATKYDREIADLFTAIRHHTRLDHAGRLLALNNQRHLRPQTGWRLSSATFPAPLKTRLNFRLAWISNCPPWL